ncbi:hypothetical protein [Paenibacillus sp. FSL W7-1287]|uniref:hypothetical protein n=1 Tax=Paenibacillus sp. FSL W7-1287 TaxID=2954538 RepID=UPI0030F5E027
MSMKSWIAILSMLVILMACSACAGKGNDTAGNVAQNQSNKHEEQVDGAGNEQINGEGNDQIAVEGIDQNIGGSVDSTDDHTDSEHDGLTNDQPNPSPATQGELVPLEHQYAIVYEDHVIPLKALDDEVDLESIFGAPMSTNVQEVKGDTLTGSLQKTTIYEGLQLELFSPKQNREQFWIMSISLTASGYPTTKGIEVGSSLDEALIAYPELVLSNDGRSKENNGAYIVQDPMEYNFMELEVKDGIIEKIEIYHLIP